jgi:hypothetical protein
MTIVVDPVMAETRATFSRKGTSFAEGGHASWIRRLLVASCILGVIGGLTALGVWQLERRVWKLDLNLHQQSSGICDDLVRASLCVFRGGGLRSE